MVKKEHRSLEEILNSLKEAEKEFDEKLDKYGMKEIKPKKQEEQEENIENDQNHIDEDISSETQNSSSDESAD